MLLTLVQIGGGDRYGKRVWRRINHMLKLLFGPLALGS